MNGEEKEGSIEERKSNESSIMTAMMMNWAQTKLHVKDEEYQHALALSHIMEASLTCQQILDVLRHSITKQEKEQVKATRLCYYDLVVIEKPANGDTTWPLKAAVLGLNEGKGL